MKNTKKKPSKKVASKPQAMPHPKLEVQRGRFYFSLFFLALIMVALIGRAFYVQVFEQDFFQTQADRQHNRTKIEETHRGYIFDRYETPLAISVPLYEIAINPKKAYNNNAMLQIERWQALALALNMDAEELTRKVTEHRHRGYLSLKRPVNPTTTQYIRELKITGIDIRKMSKRFYPTAEVSAHIIGFAGESNSYKERVGFYRANERGLEGVEKLYQEHLSGRAGKRSMKVNKHGEVIEFSDIEQSSDEVHDVVLAIDQRIQDIAYRHLKKGWLDTEAISGTVVVVDVQTNELLALVNTPSYNPNKSSDRKPYQMRNRGLTDTFEPGSIVKPLVIASALEHGYVEADEMVSVSPRVYKVSGGYIRDSSDYGQLSLGGILVKSSNIGISKIALRSTGQEVQSWLTQFGMGNFSGLNLPGEEAGILNPRHRWSQHEVASMAYGYGFTATAVQMARAYTVLANGGLLRPLSLTKLNADSVPAGKRVLSEKVAKEVVAMMSGIAEKGGTGTKAKIDGFTVAGKTGTSRKAVAGGYGNEYVASFIGMAPAENPRLVVAVLVNDPKGDRYYGGDVAAPIFKQVMHDSLRLMNVEPTTLDNPSFELAKKR